MKYSQTHTHIYVHTLTSVGVFGLGFRGRLIKSSKTSLRSFKSELNFPIGNKQELDLAASGDRFNFPIFLYDAVFYQSAYNVGWGVSTPGNDEMMAAMREAFPDRRPSDSFISGWNESVTMHRVLETAIANGDLTRAGVVAAANSLETVDFGGSAPNQSYAGAPNDFVVRESAIFDPDLATYTAAGGAEQTLSQDDATTGSLLKKDFFVGDAAAAFEFTSPCFEL